MADPFADDTRPETPTTGAVVLSADGPQPTGTDWDDVEDADAGQGTG